MNIPDIFDRDFGGAATWEQDDCGECGAGPGECDCAEVFEQMMAEEADYQRDILRGNEK